MKRPVSVGTRKEVLRALGVQYRNACRSVKARILDELVAITGYHRKHAIRVLRISKHMDQSATERSRILIYDEAVREVLIVVWEVADRICSRRLKAIIPCLVESMERHGHLRLDPSVRNRLMAASASPIMEEKTADPASILLQ